MLRRHFRNLIFGLGFIIFTAGCSTGNQYRFSHTSRLAQQVHVPLIICSDSAAFLKHQPEATAFVDLNKLAPKKKFIPSAKIPAAEVVKASAKIPEPIPTKKQNALKLPAEKHPADPPWGALFLAAITIFLLTLVLLTGLVFLFIFIAKTWGVLVFFGSLIAFSLLIRFGFPLLLKVAAILLHVFLNIFVKQGVR